MNSHQGSGIGRGLSLLIAAFIVIQTACPCSGHQASDGYLSLMVTNSAVMGRLDLAVQDLHALLDLDDDVDGRISWGELKAHREEAVGYIATNLFLKLNGSGVSLGEMELLVDEHSEASFSVWKFSIPTATPVKELEVTYRCLFEVDALHRAFVKVEGHGSPMTAMLSPSRPTQRFDLETTHSSAQHGTTGFFREGIWHIWTGYDHVLFLLALLLPAVVCRRENRWQGVERLRPALISVFKTVTAFTLAHSVTLTLAALGWVRLPARFVEPVIAASVALAALNNIRPFVLERGWWVALGFGLIHGFGFAGVLQEMDLSGGSLLWPLLGFNLGVEAGQAVIVLIFVPIAFALRNSSFYRVGALRYGSAAIAVLAALWFFERVF
jgi:HupE / UreJ protein